LPNWYVGFCTFRSRPSWWAIKEALGVPRTCGVHLAEHGLWAHPPRHHGRGRRCGRRMRLLSLGPRRGPCTTRGGLLRVLRTQVGGSRTKRPPEPSTASCPQATQRGLPLLDLQALARLDHLLHTRPRRTEPRIGATGTHAPAGGSVVVGWARPDAARR